MSYVIPTVRGFLLVVEEECLETGFPEHHGKQGDSRTTLLHARGCWHRLFTRSLTVISWNKETYVRHSLFVKVFYLVYKLNVVDVFGLNDVDVLALGLHLCGKEAHVLVAMHKGVLGGDRLQFVAL